MPLKSSRIRSVILHYDFRLVSQQTTTSRRTGVTRGRQTRRIVQSRAPARSLPCAHNIARSIRLHGACPTHMRRRYGVRLRHKVRRAKDKAGHLVYQGAWGSAQQSEGRRSQRSPPTPRSSHPLSSRTCPPAAPIVINPFLREPARLWRAYMRLSSWSCTLTNRLPRAPSNWQGRRHRSRRAQP